MAKKTYHLFNPGRLSRKDNTLKFTPVDSDGKEGKPRYLPVEQVEMLNVFGSLEANSALYTFLGKNEVSVNFFDYYENYSGSFMPRNKLLSGRVLIAQTEAYLNKKKRISIAQQILDGASYNMLQNLKYYDRRKTDLSNTIREIEALRDKLPKTKKIEELMGLEGNIRKIYYQCFDPIITDFEMGGRSMQPPKNEVNALISFGNMMCYSQCLRAIHRTQLDPTISYLHSPGDRRYSLSLDLAEIFKPVLIDRLLFKLLNKRMLREEHFDKQVGKILLGEKGKKIFIEAYENRLDETIKHRKLGREVSYKTLIKMECYKLVKHIMEIEEYKPFKMYW